MDDTSHDRSRIGDNRLAAVVVIGSLLAAVAIGVVYQDGLLDYLVPGHGPAADAVPLYLLFAVVLLALVVWSWRRLLSWFE